MLRPGPPPNTASTGWPPPARRSYFPPVVEEGKKEEERVYCRERFYGTFQRSFRLPAGVESDKVEANFKNGVLTVSVPKSEEGKHRKIEIKSV